MDTEAVVRSMAALFGALLFLTMVFRALERWRWRGLRRRR